MRKLAFLITILAFICFSVSAQEDERLFPKHTYKTAGGGAADTVSLTGTVTKVFFIDVPELHQYAMAINLTKLSGTTDSIFVSEFVSLDGINYPSTANAIDTIKTADADKYVILSTIADAGHRYYKYVVSGDVTNTQKLKVLLEMKIWNKVK